MENGNDSLDTEMKDASNPQQNFSTSSNKMKEEIKPNQTLYVNNLNERIKKDELRRSLYAIFSQFGTVLDVVALKTLKMRGQAHIVFKDVTSATNAMRSLQNFTFYDKQMKITYAKSKSDVISKMDGTFVPRTKKIRKKQEEQKAKKTKKEGAKPKKEKKEEDSFGTPAHLQPKQQPPNKILFVENLPEACTDMMLSMLFQQFPGFKEVRMVQGKQGIAFVEFESEVESTVAMNGLQHFKITPTHLMVISYAKK